MSRRVPVILFAIGLLTAMLVDRGAAQAADRDGVRPLPTKTSLLGKHHWFQQTYGGIDVLGGVLARHVYNDGHVVAVDRGRAVGRAVDVRPTVSRADAEAAAGGDPVRTDLNVQPGDQARLVWAVYANPPTGTTRTLVDAHTGDVVSVERIARDADGSGVVFDPNPVVTLQDQTLTDQFDANYPALAGAYRTVPLRHLDGFGQLTGEFANVLADEPAFSDTNTFAYDRSQTQFSQTMAYYHLTKAQEYIQSLGFADINNHPQAVAPDAFDLDNSFYDPADDIILLGTGGVDDAEDADVMLHEYGHAVQDDQVPGFGGLGDSGAIGEGFADYWAVTVSEPANNGYEVPCVADWDAVSFTTTEPHCLRRVDTDLTVDDRSGEVHHDGQIWARALWDIHQQLGRENTDIIVLESQFAFSPEISFTDAALVTVDTALQLFGDNAARVVRQAFTDRGILGGFVEHATHPRKPQGPPKLREIARLFEQAPGGGRYEFDFEPYGLSEDATAFYAADVTTGGEGIFLNGRTGVSQLLRSGQPAPGGGTFGIGVLAGPTFNRGGEAAMAFFRVPFLRPAGRNAGVYRATSGEVRAVMVPDDDPQQGGFVGAAESTSINDSGSIAFAGMTLTDKGIAGPYGMGVYVATPDGAITTVAAPGDAAPGGLFDYAADPYMNNDADVVFGGHLKGSSLCPSQAFGLGCARDLFLRDADTGLISRLVGVGQPAPGGGTFRDIRFPVINSAGDVLFRAFLNTPEGVSTGYFLHRDGTLIKVARAGDPMPGGGNFVGTAFQPGNWHLNDRGDVAFSAALDSHDNIFGDCGGDPDCVPLSDTGLYTWSGGKTSLVARSGMVVAEGEIVQLQPPSFLGTAAPFSGAQLNNSRQVLFQAAVAFFDEDRLLLDGILYVRE